MPMLSPEERCGTTLASKYRLERILGRGGMGVVYRGLHLWTGRSVALKLLQPGLSTDETTVTRFLNEARAAACLRHPNVVDVLDMGRCEDGTAYLVLELLEGETLEVLLRRGPLPLPLLFDVMLPVMHALSTAHAAGIVHRDVKPANIFVQYDSKGRVYPKLLDFGIAKLSNTGSLATRSGTLMGSPHYMSPEQARADHDVTAASDIFSCGAVWYHALTGEPPFKDESVTLVLVRIITKRAAYLRKVAPALPVPLARAVDRALEPKPLDRYPSMLDFVRTMRQVGDALSLNLRFDSMLPPGAGAPRPDPGALSAADAPLRASARIWRRGLRKPAAAALLLLAAAGAWHGSRALTSDAAAEPRIAPGADARPRPAAAARTPLAEDAPRFVEAVALPAEPVVGAGQHGADAREPAAEPGPPAGERPAASRKPRARRRAARRERPASQPPRAARPSADLGNPSLPTAAHAPFGLTSQRGAAPAP